jgi:hypothetical protein
MLDRRLLAGPIHRRQLRKEVAASLDAMAARVTSSGDEDTTATSERFGLPSRGQPIQGLS